MPLLCTCARCPPSHLVIANPESNVTSNACSFYKSVREHAMTLQISFNPEQLGFFKKAGWEAYYDRNWGRVLRLMVALNHEEFRMPWHLAVLAAFYRKARRSVGMQATMMASTADSVRTRCIALLLKPAYRKHSSST